jgi:hypothetical protein
MGREGLGAFPWFEGRQRRHPFGKSPCKEGVEEHLVNEEVRGSGRHNAGTVYFIRKSVGKDVLGESPQPGVLFGA